METTENSISNEIRQEEDAFLKAATADPDHQELGGGIPDHVAGKQTVLKQNINAVVNTDGTAILPTGTWDLWIVQWDIESVEPLTGHYLQRVSGSNGYYKNTPISNLTVGGLCCYVMSPGTSPFPSDNPSTIGPVAPLKTVQLIFGGSVINERTRSVGMNFKTKYIGNALNAQGQIVQAQQYNFKNKNFCYWNDTVITDSVEGEITTIIDIPPGSAPALMAYQGSINKDVMKGSYQSAIMNYFNNEPERKNGFLRNYFSSVKPSGSSNYLDLFVGHRKRFGGVVDVCPGYWDNGANMSFAVYTGLIGSGGVSVTRELIQQNFPQYGDALFPLATNAPLCNNAVIEDVVNAQALTSPFGDFDDNASGGFMKKMFGAYKKIKKVAAPIAKAVLPPSQLALINGLARSAKPYTSLMKTVIKQPRSNLNSAKQVAKRRKTQKQISQATAQLQQLQHKALTQS